MDNQLMPEKLFVGAIIYETYSKRINSIMQIERVTKTMAISGNNRFKIDVSPNGFVRKIQSSSWDVSSYQIETKDIKERLNHQNLYHSVKESIKNIESLTTEQLQRIQSIIQENKNP